MRAPLGWLRELAALPDDLDARDLAERLIDLGLEVERVEDAGGDVTGPLVVGRVLEATPEPQKNGKTINWCTVDVGGHNPEGEAGRGIVCGAHNFGAGDLVVVALAGAVLPGDFAIAARKTYGHVSDGMICSAAELGLPGGGDGIIVVGDTDDDGRPLVPGQDAATVLHLRDQVLDIAVTPNLGYCFSLRGLAREAAAAYDVEFVDPVDRPFPGELVEGHPVRIETPRCTAFSALTVSGLDAARPTPRWMQRRLQLAGMRPISLAVDVTNYVMLHTGQPLHGYDQRRLQGAVVVRQAAEGERLTTLDGTVRTLVADDVVIADDSGPIGLAGVMGGQHSELADDTSTLVIEAAHFDALSVARTSRRHRLSSEASRRFERGVDPQAGYAAARLAARLLVELGGGALEPAHTVVGDVPDEPQQRLPVDLPSRVLGVEVPAEQVVALLQRGGTVVVPDGEELLLTPPSWRQDLRDPYDWVEEVGRSVGLETIPPVLPVAPPGRGLTASQRARRAVNAALAATGHVEVLSLPFASEADLDRLRVPAEDPRRRLVRVANPLAETSPYLRTTLLPALLAAVARNASRGTPDLAVHEIGSVFLAREDGGVAPRPSVTRRPSDSELAALDAALPEQPRHLAVVLSGDWLPAGVGRPAVPSGWQHAVAAAEAAAREVGLRLGRRAADTAPWHPGRCAALLVGDEVVGHAGELHPSVCEELGVPARTSAMELDLDRLIELAPPGGEVSPLSAFPVAKVDVAVVVEASVPSAEVEAALLAGGGELVESIRLFDVYTSDALGAGRKSLAYALVLRAPDRTLTDAEALAVRNAAVSEAARRHGAELRT
ncbi:phenylalanine--tRNA ligase subunit beta [Auraticoccus monumenti]|uniref:Phenylalanine--tRNA ligase beta subunit n=1 Tax=Auraticoccus monumenti TaxID=675864 RepID=A0A1G7CWV7_9ACTN|nr:phenylalanine--tRNA ligase subunit beta [Auraticoccus monumenti]SDE43944.1 phenylalanyl-tRNA synthetase beta subunit [Auraticoccus monumenti]